MSTIAIFHHREINDLLEGRMNRGDLLLLRALGLSRKN